MDDAQRAAIRLVSDRRSFSSVIFALLLVRVEFARPPCAPLAPLRCQRPPLCFSQGLRLSGSACPLRCRSARRPKPALNCLLHDDTRAPWPPRAPCPPQQPWPLPPLMRTSTVVRLALTARRRWPGYALVRWAGCVIATPRPVPCASRLWRIYALSHPSHALFVHLRPVRGPASPGVVAVGPGLHPASVPSRAPPQLVTLRVLIVGVKGVGIETAKNLVLAGPGAVTLFDNGPAEAKDMGANFFLTPAHVGTPRADAVVGALRELNRDVLVRSAREWAADKGTRDGGMRVQLCVRVCVCELCVRVCVCVNYVCVCPPPRPCSQGQGPRVLPRHRRPR